MTELERILVDALNALLERVECGSALNCEVCKKARAALTKAKEKAGK